MNSNDLKPHYIIFVNTNVQYIYIYTGTHIYVSRNKYIKGIENILK